MNMLLGIEMARRLDSNINQYYNVAELEHGEGRCQGCDRLEGPNQISKYREICSSAVAWPNIRKSRAFSALIGGEARLWRREATAEIVRQAKSSGGGRKTRWAVGDIMLWHFARACQ